LVGIENCAEDAPLGIVTEAGTPAAVFDELRFTVRPEAGAAPFRLSEPTTELPPATGFGASPRPVNAAAVIDSVPLLFVPLRLAVTVAVVDVDCPLVAIVKLALDAPAGTVTVVGTFAPVEDERLTVAPPLGAARARVTVPVAELPPTTEFGEMLRPASSGTSTFRFAETVAPFRPAVIVTFTLLATNEVVTVKVALDAPAGTVTIAGTAALKLFEAKVTVAPPGPAAPFKVMVPNDGFPPTTDVGETVNPLSDAAVIVSVADWVAPACVAVIVAVRLLDTAAVTIVKDAEVAPGATVTLAGNVALVLLDERLTTVPPGPAGPVRVTVPVEGTPPRTNAGESVRLLRVAGVIVNVAVWVAPLTVPAIIAVTLPETAVVATVKVDEVAPEATEIEAGNMALVLFDDRYTTTPPGPAIPLNVTVPIEEDPPATDVGLTVIVANPGPDNRDHTMPAAFWPPWAAVPYRLPAPSNVTPAQG
jgi:hypothetical protein